MLLLRLEGGPGWVGVGWPEYFHVTMKYFRQIFLPLYLSLSALSWAGCSGSPSCSCPAGSRQQRRSGCSGSGGCHDDDDSDNDDANDNDVEPGSDGDGDTEGGAVAAEAPLGQGEVALVVRRDDPLTNQR